MDTKYLENLNKKLEITTKLMGELNALVSDYKNAIAIKNERIALLEELLRVKGGI